MQEPVTVNLGPDEVGMFVKVKVVLLPLFNIT